MEGQVNGWAACLVEGGRERQMVHGWLYGQADEWTVVGRIRTVAQARRCGGWGQGSRRTVAWEALGNGLGWVDDGG